MAEEAANSGAAGGTPAAAPTGGDSPGGTSGFTSGSAGPGSSFDIDLDQDFDSITIPSGKPQASPAGPQASGVIAPEDPTASSTAAPAAVVPAVAAPQAPPVQQQPAQQPAAQAAPAGDPSAVISTPEQFQQAWDEGRDNLIERIAQEQFALSDEDMVALDQQPQVALPRLLARVLFTAISSAQRLMIDQVPLIVGNHMKQQTTQRSATEAFYTKFPHLKDPRHLATVQRFADVYKAQFPDMPLEQRIDEIGRLAMNHLNIQAQQPQQPQRAQPAGRIVSHQPAAAASGGRGGPIAVNQDPFAGAFVDWGD